MLNSLGLSFASLGTAIAISEMKVKGAEFNPKIDETILRTNTVEKS